MYEFKVVITQNEGKINLFLEEGWKIVSVTAQYIGGNFCFVLKK